MSQDSYDRDSVEFRLAVLGLRLGAVIVRARPGDRCADDPLRDEVERRLARLEARVAVLEARRRNI